MVVNLRRFRRWRADETGQRWQVGHYRKDINAARLYRVFLNGREVTHDTFYVDTRRGVIRMHLRTSDGHVYLDGDEVAWVEKRGHVKLIRRKNRLGGNLAAEAA